MKWVILTIIFTAVALFFLEWHSNTCYEHNYEDEDYYKYK